MVERIDLSRGPASVLAAKQALAVAGLDVGQVDLFDFYSCFPIAVFNMLEGLGLEVSDPRPFTVTGGLPFFGGAGNNYSMHAIASMARALRERPGAFGLVGANGGFLSKYSVGIYSTKAPRWRGFDSHALQAEIDAWPAPALAPAVHGREPSRPTRSTTAARRPAPWSSARWRTEAAGSSPRAIRRTTPWRGR